MADNVTITSGTGTTIAADDIAGVKHQRVKIEHGADGVATDVSTASPLPVTAGDVATTLINGRKTVTTAGTALAITTTTACKWVTVTAIATNTQQVNVGGTGVIAAAGTETGAWLDAGMAITIPIDDLAKVFVNSRVNGEGVTFLAGV